MRDMLPEMQVNPYNKPGKCHKCGGQMIFKGVGEYHCEKCGAVEYDDYGKVRMYIEQHHGATAQEVEDKTGVKQKVIRHLLKEERIEVAPDSKVSLVCEICRQPIRSGRFCPACAKLYHEKEEKLVKNQKKKIQGFGKAVTGQSGEKRYMHDIF